MIPASDSSEVWTDLGPVKKEFESFGGMPEKAQKNVQTASDQLDEVMGKRTRAIQRKLQGLEALDADESQTVLLILRPVIDWRKIND